MSGKVVNLNRARKARARDADRQRADENAIRHGLSKTEKAAQAARAKAEADRIDGHKRDE